MPGSRNGGVGAPRLTRHARREHLLDVAAELITDAGLDAVTMEGVAARAGVSKGLGYAYFANRDELLVALFDREMASLDQRVFDAMVDETSFEARMRGLLGVVFDITAERGLLMGALLQARLSDGPLERRRRERHGDVVDFFAGLVSAEYGFAPKDAVAAAGILIGAYGGALDLWINGRGSRRRLIDSFIAMSLAGLGALAARAGVGA
jgi:AcrR family transcriptional regulator